MINPTPIFSFNAFVILKISGGKTWNQRTYKLVA